MNNFVFRHRGHCTSSVNDDDSEGGDDEGKGEESGDSGDDGLLAVPE